MALIFSGDTLLLLAAALGLVATLIAILRDTQIRPRSLGPATG